jgi:hypothetical protein
MVYIKIVSSHPTLWRLIGQEFLLRADTDELKHIVIKFSNIILDFGEEIMIFIGLDKENKLLIFLGGG